MNCCEEKIRSDPAWGLRALEHLRRRAGNYAMSDLPLQDASQYVMLLTVFHMTEDGSAPSQRELAKVMHLSPATVTATLKILEKSGHIRKIPDEKDLRINRVVLTEEGESVMREGMRRLRELDKAMQEGFTDEELEELNRCLNKMRDNLLRTMRSKEANAHD